MRSFSKLVAIFTYGLPACKENFEKADCQYVTLTDYDTLIPVAVEHNYIHQDDMEKLKAWKVNPRDKAGWKNNKSSSKMIRRTQCLKD